MTNSKGCVDFFFFFCHDCILNPNNSMKSECKWRNEYRKSILALSKSTSLFLTKKWKKKAYFPPLVIDNQNNPHTLYSAVNSNIYQVQKASLNLPPPPIEIRLSINLSIMNSNTCFREMLKGRSNAN